MGITKMAKGKNKQISKKGGARGKQERHPFSKKQWYKIQSPPNVHNSVQVGWTPVNKTMGTKLSKDGLLGGVCDVSYGDIQDPTNFAWKKIRMQIEEVKGSACYTSFYGINIIREKLYNYLRKRMTLIDVVADVKTADGYILRTLITTFTAKKLGQVKNNTYAKHSQVRAIRKAFVTLPEELPPAPSVTSLKMSLTRISHKSYWTRVKRSTHFLTFYLERLRS